MQVSSVGYLKQRYAFLHGASGDHEKILSTRDGEASIAFGDVGRDGNGIAVQLIRQKAVTSRELFGNSAGLIRVRNGFLIDE